MSDDNLHLDDDEARVDALLSSMDAGDLELETPPASIWAGIEAELVEDAPSTPVAPVISLASRRRPAMIAAAVAAALILVAGLAVVLTGEDTGAVEVASAELVYLDDTDGFIDDGAGRSADATLLQDGDREILRVDRADLPGSGDDADLEIWLIGVSDGEIQIVQTLGLVDPGDPRTYDVPADFDRDAYDAVAVDISVEPHDGDEAHSGMSLIRGALVEI